MKLPFIADTSKNSRGFLTPKAYRLTPQAIELYKAGDFLPDTIRNLKVSHDNLFQEVPIVVKNSHLVNELLLELSEQVRTNEEKIKALISKCKRFLKLFLTRFYICLRLLIVIIAYMVEFE